FLGAGVLLIVAAKNEFRWPLVSQQIIGERFFSWRHLAGFLAINLFAIVPLAMIYVAFCLGLALDHYTGGFVGLRPGGLVMRARKYTREDGKTIQLIPMM